MSSTDDSELKTESRRQHPRKKVFLRAELRSGNDAAPCDILNLSAGGARISSTLKVSAGSRVILNLEPFGELPGEIVWQNGEEMGINFQKDPAQIAEIVLGIALYG